jgi:uncharacterized membrane protein YtjA (UPF0391 family)
MLRYALIFLVVAGIAGVLRLIGITSALIGIATILFFLFIALLAVSSIYDRRRRATSASSLVDARTKQFSKFPGRPS